MWLIIAVILIVLISSIMENTDNKLAYSELISKIEAGEVKEITLASDGGKAEVKLKNENFSKEVNIPSVENLMNSLSESMKAGTVKVTEKSESIWMVVFSLLTPFGLLIIFFIFGSSLWVEFKVVLEEMAMEKQCHLEKAVQE